MEKFKKGIDVYGWIACVGAVILLWVVCLWDPLHDYFIPNAIELTKLVVALFGTIVIWLFQLLSGGREWLEAQKESMEWAWDKAVEVVREVDKVGVKSFKEIHNIGVESGAESFGVNEGIGED